MTTVGGTTGLAARVTTGGITGLAARVTTGDITGLAAGVTTGGITGGATDAHVSKADYIEVTKVGTNFTMLHARAWPHMY